MWPGRLKVSEGSIKRTFANESFTLTRLAQISELLGFTLAELLQLAATSVPPLDTLTIDQETQLVSDDKLILVAVCALNHWSLADMLSFYDITKMEAIKRLRILDRMGLIELLPGDRIRRRAKRDFDWIQDGPIRRYFAKQGLGDFIAGPFDPDDESLDFAHGMLTPAAQAELKLELRRLRGKLAGLHEQSISADIAEKARRRCAPRHAALGADRFHAPAADRIAGPPPQSRFNGGLAGLRACADHDVVAVGIPQRKLLRPRRGIRMRLFVESVDEGASPP
jgi:hypothetical protein